MALSAADAEKMIAASEQAGVLLTVAMVRRLSWSSLLLKKLMRSGMLGAIQRFDIESGEEYKWPLRDGHTFTDSASGGVLADIGPHLLDLLFWFLGSQQAQLDTYSDDSWGGVAANATMELAVQLPGGPVPGRIELSFTRRLRNTLRIYGETGCLEAPLALNGYELFFYPGGQEVEPVILKLPGAVPRKNQVTFALQLSHFADLVRGEAQDYATGREALATISVIELCQRLRKRVAQPWELKHVEPFFEVNPHA
jgi:predicted dehydrogenase